MEAPGARILGPGRRRMIDKRQLLDEAVALSLLPQVVKKDYTLG